MILPAYFAYSVAAGCEKSFFGLHSWFHYLNVTRSGNPAICQVQFQFPDDVPLVALAIIDDLLMIAGVVAVFYVVYGGIRYITSQGSPEEVSKAQGTVLNAIIGLVICLFSIGIVSYIGTHYGG